MTSAELEGPHRLGPTRARVLALLQDVAEAMDAAEIGDRLGMHPNSVRFHLDALTAIDLVTRARRPRTMPGRPRVTYAASNASPDMTRRHYRLLAEVLSRLLHNHVPSASAVAEQMGREWSRSVSAQPPQRARSKRQGLEILVESLVEVGFESHVVDDDESHRVEISHCP